MNLAIIGSTQAKQLREKPKLQERLHAIAEKEHTFCVIVPKVPVEELHEAYRSRLASFPEWEITTAAVCGGDGTTNITLAALLDVYEYNPNGSREVKLQAPHFPDIFFANGGTFANIATDLGSKKAPDKNIEAHIANCRKGVETRTHQSLLKIEEGTQEGLTRVSYGFIFGYGALEKFMAKYDVQPNLMRVLSLVSQITASSLTEGDMAREILKKPIEEDIIINGASYDTPVNIIAASANNTKVFVVSPFSKAGDRPHLYAVTIGVNSFYRNIGPALRGEQLDFGDEFNDVVDSFEIRGKDQTTALPYMIDGDLRTAYGFLRVSKGPILDVVQL